jgi:20S proteasome subunit beta 3
MVGKDCVAIACDLRLGLQALTVSNNFPKIFQYGDVFLGLTGLATDVSTVSDLFRYKVNMYRLREERNIAPRTFANLVSSSLYEKRFGPYFVSPVVAGLEPKTGKPFICGFDSIGCIDFAKDFIVSGTATDQLYGMCESLWEPDLVRLKYPSSSSSMSEESRLTRSKIAGTGGAVRDDITIPPECRGQRRSVGLGCSRLHHREGQGHKEVAEGTARLDQRVVVGRFSTLAVECTICIFWRRQV